MKKIYILWPYSLILLGFVLMFTNPVSIYASNPSNTVTDIDGNVYHTITIGTQVWMVENLKTTKYSNGDSIPEIADGKKWSNLTTGAYCNYHNETKNSTTYGRLYNWYAVNDSRNIAPIGWHVPSDAEWTTLIIYLGGEDVTGGKLKEKGTTHWQSPNTGATNETGFTALPDGNRGNDGTFNYIGNYGFWWSSTGYYAHDAWYWYAYYNFSNVFRHFNNKVIGFSVRCIRD